MNFKKGLDPKQEFLIAKKPGDYVKEEHMAKAVYAISEKLNMQNIIEKYSELGQNAYNPLMLIRIIFYGYAIGVRSSRKLAKACEERLDFLYLADGLKPSHNAISDFRKENLEKMKVHFQEILLIAAGLNIVSLGNLNVCIDGSKIKANASPKLSKDEDKLQELLDKTQADINRMFQEAEEIDRQEDDLYGKENRGDELPKEIRNKEERKEAIEKAVEKLRKQKEALKEKIRTEKNREPTDVELKKINKKKINITDNDAPFMKQRNGVIKPCFNVQISVDEDSELIIANDVTIDCNDQHQLINMVQQTINNSGKEPKKVKADNGYHPELTEAVEKYPKIDFFVDDKNRRKQILYLYELQPKYSDAEYKNILKLLTPEGEAEYKKRMHTAETPFGHLKYNLGLTEFLLREIKKAKGEFNLMSIGYNLKKIFNLINRKDINLAQALKNINLMPQTT